MLVDVPLAETLLGKEVEVYSIWYDDDKVWLMTSKGVFVTFNWYIRRELRDVKLPAEIKIVRAGVEQQYRLNLYVVKRCGDC